MKTIRVMATTKSARKWRQRDSRDFIIATLARYVWKSSRLWIWYVYHMYIAWGCSYEVSFSGSLISFGSIQLHLTFFEPHSLHIGLSSLRTMNLKNDQNMSCLDFAFPIPAQTSVDSKILLFVFSFATLLGSRFLVRILVKS